MKAYGLFVFVFLALLITVHSGASSSSLQISVYTDSPFYDIAGNIHVYGYVKLDSVPIANLSVGLEVHDPADNVISTRTPETNMSGIYSIQFKLPLGAPTGTYTVYVTCSHDGMEAHNNTSFDVELISGLVLTVETSKSSYKKGENITIYGNVTFDQSPLQGVPVALEVQDPQLTPIVIRSRETNINGSYELTFRLSDGPRIGNYTVHATASYEALKATAETVFVYGYVEGIPGDVDGDGDVDIYDIVIICAAYGSQPRDPNWDPRADIAEPYNKIDIYDVVVACSHYGEGKV